MRSLSTRCIAGCWVVGTSKVGFFVTHDTMIPSRRRYGKVDNQKVVIIINKLSGTAEFTQYGVELNGPWASHTGFRSVTGAKSNDGDVGMLYSLAEAAYEESRRYSFAVGHEHCEHGWKTLIEDWQGNITVRLPSWHKDVVAEALKAYGMELECQVNTRWVLPARSGVRIDVVRQLLAPILRPMTRFVDEHVLAQEIDDAACSMGFNCRRPLQAGRAQRALF